MPAELRTDTGYPKLQWNAFTATGMCPTSQMDPKAWDPVEEKYYPLIKEAAALGFEEMNVDVGWWNGLEPDTDLTDWPRGMGAAAAATHEAGLRFGVYWTDAEPMATPEGRAARTRRVKRLFAEHGADTWRSDATRGQVIAPDYWSVKGFYAMLDALRAEVPGFQWENCSGGGPIKDYGAMRRATKIQICDTVDEAIVTRRVFHDSSHALHPLQMQGFLGWHSRARPGEPGGITYDFRSAGLGAFMWWIDSPAPTNGGVAWTAEERQAVAREVQTYKTRLRPLIRHANLYHVLPRPADGNWDGIEYYDPAKGQGVVYVFKPGSGPDSHAIKLKGLEADRAYRLTFEDGSNPAVIRPGEALMRDGVSMTLRGRLASELVWIERT
jgi:alpha-galactosidase